MALKQKQSLPLDAKITLSQARIKEWYDHYDGEVYVSFSGGKDSTVLKHLVETTIGVKDVPSVFVDTGLEYPELKAFIRSFKNVVILHPKMRFDEVVKKYGFPVISKEVSNKIANAKPENTRWQQLKGIYIDPKTGEKSKYNCAKYEDLLNAPFKISDKCCDIMKKAPAKEYGKKTGKKPILALMAAESRKRAVAYLNTGCNAYDKKDPQSQPIAFWTEQDILEYIVRFKLPYASVYGDIKTDDNGKYYLTGAKRTGCMFCLYGIGLEDHPNRLEQMKVTHPAQYRYCLDVLGERAVLDYLKIKY